MSWALVRRFSAFSFKDFSPGSFIPLAPPFCEFKVTVVKLDLLDIPLNIEKSD